jgi:hypothetical protein
MFLTRARKGHWGQKSKVNLQQLDSRSLKCRTDLVCEAVNGLLFK